MWKKRCWSLLTSKFSPAFFWFGRKNSTSTFLWNLWRSKSCSRGCQTKILTWWGGWSFFFFRLQRISNAVWVGTLVLPGNSAIVTLLACFSDPLKWSWVTSHESPGRFVVVLLDFFFSPLHPPWGGWSNLTTAPIFSGFDDAPSSGAPFSRGGTWKPPPQQSYLWKR